MSKFIVETTGSFTLVEPHQTIPYNRPAVVSPSHFLETRGQLGQVRILAADLDDEATDGEFAQYLTDAENRDLAITSFVEKYDGTIVQLRDGDSDAQADAPASKPPTRAEKKAAEAAAKAAAKQDGAE